ncbi:MAG: hypothetical protein WED09_07240 [Homoserinimonas sp.]
MALEAFATAAQMASRSQGAIPAGTPFLDDELKAATQLIRNYCGWRIADQAAEDIWLDRLSGPALFLPSLHVVSVDALVVDGVTADTSDLKWLSDGRLSAPYWVPVGQSAKVTITHGLTAAPPEIVSLTLQVAARALGSPLGIVREQAGAVSVTYSQAGFNIAGGSVLLPHEKLQLDGSPYKIGWTA